MKSKLFIIIPAFIALCLTLQAAPPVVFLQNGGNINDTIIDMSSRNGRVEFRHNGKIHRSQIWLINYENSQWNFPHERKRLSRNSDTVILRNGGVIYENVIDFSSRQRRYEFSRNAPVHESMVKRIYFCCTSLPPAYKQGSGGHNNSGSSSGGAESMTFMLTGRTIDSTLEYLNFRKTKFKNGLQINTKDIWMINFVNDSYDFPRERRNLDRRLDTIILSNGEVLYDTVTDYNASRGTFRFENINPISVNKIDRIYFCCTALPDAFKSRRRGTSRFKRSGDRRR